MPLETIVVFSPVLPWDSLNKARSLKRRWPIEGDVQFFWDDRDLVRVDLGSRAGQGLDPPSLAASFLLYEPGVRSEAGLLDTRATDWWLGATPNRYRGDEDEAGRAFARFRRLILSSLS